MPALVFGRFTRTTCGGVEHCAAVRLCVLLCLPAHICHHIMTIKPEEACTAQAQFDVFFGTKCFWRIFVLFSTNAKHLPNIRLCSSQLFIFGWRVLRALAENCSIACARACVWAIHPHDARWRRALCRRALVRITVPISPHMPPQYDAH